MKRVGFIAMVWLGACSFTNTTGFDECVTDLDCATSSVCVRRFCLPLPKECRREAGSFDKGDRIPLAALLPLSRVDGGIDLRERYRLSSMRLALEEANKSGGLKSRQFALFVCDAPNSDDTNLTQSLTHWLVTNLETPAILVSGSTRVRDAAYERARVDAGTFLMSPNATDPGLAAIHKDTGNVWRVAPSDNLQAAVLTTLVKGTVTPRATIGILYPTTDYGRGLALPLSDQLVDAGYEARLVEMPDKLDATSALAPINTLANRSPAATVLIGFPDDVVQLISAANARTVLQPANGHRWFMADGAKDPAILTASTRAALEGMLGTTPAQGQGSAYRTFRDTFENRFNVSVDSYSYTAHSYDAMWLTLGSAAWAVGGDITGPRMRDGILNMSKSGPAIPLVGASWSTLSLSLSGNTGVNADGSSGELLFDVSTGSPASQYEVWTIADGGLATVRYVTP